MTKDEAVRLRNLLPLLSSSVTERDVKTRNRLRLQPPPASESPTRGGQGVRFQFPSAPE